MKNKRAVLISSLIGACALSLGALTLLARNNNLLFAQANNNECAHHHGNHYLAKAPTTTESGWQEFWACCVCGHQYIGSAPSGDWIDQDFDYMTGGVGIDHIAYLPPVEYSSKLKTAVFADIQLCYKENGSDSHGAYRGNAGSVVHAYLALKNHFALCKKQNVDVILMNGDIANNAIEKYYELYEEAFESVYGTDDSQYPEIIWNMGNHEWWDINEHETAEAVSMFKQYARINTSNLVRQSNVKYYLDNNETLPTYYKVVNGVPFLVVSGENSSGEIGNTMSAEIASWLSEISNLQSVQNGGPIYVAYHYALHTSLTHGHGSVDKCTVLEELLEDYPQAVVFTGDTHYSGVNERAINQVDFTTINIGSSSYSRMDTMSATMTGDEHFYNMAIKGGKTSDIMVGNAKFKSEYTPTIHFMDTMTDESTIINRYFSTDDFNHPTHINGAWTLPANPTKGTFEYTNDRFENPSYAHELYGANGVSWDNNAEVSFGVQDGQMTIHFPDTNEYHYTEHFKIDVTGNTTKTYDVVSNYYKYNTSPENLYFVLEDLPAGDHYSVKVTAYDYFDNPSLNYLTSSVEDSSVCAEAIDNALTLTYCDISTRMYFDDHADGSHSSIEYFYNGVLSYNAGAVLNRPILNDGVSASDYISIGNNNDCEILVRAKVKNLTNDTLTFGLTVVDGKGSWLSDFSAPTRKQVSPNANWVSLEWNLTELYNLIGRSGVSNLAIKASSSAYDDEGYVMHFLMDDVDVAAGDYIDNSRGQLFTSGANYSENANLSLDKTINIDFKFTSESNTYVQFMLGDGWSNYFGYYKVNANGTLGDSYSGLSINQLEDGYFRVTVVLNQLNKIGDGSSLENIDDINVFFIRGNWSNASGYVDFNTNADSGVIRGTPFSGGYTVDLSPIALSETINIDFKFTSGSDTCVQFVLGDGWGAYYGYYRVNANGTLGGSYSGVTIQTLEDGYYRVTIVLSQLNIGQKIENIEKINLLYLNPSLTTASGYIDFNPNI